MAPHILDQDVGPHSTRPRSPGRTAVARVIFFARSKPSVRLSTPSRAKFVDLSNVNAVVSECRYVDLVYYPSLAVTNSGSSE